MIINGKLIAEDIEKDIQEKISKISERKPALAVIMAGEDPASVIYVRNKEKKCKQVGILSESLRLPSNISENELIKKIELFNRSPNIDGILVQLPLPQHISENNIIERISPEKDVDGFHPINVGKMLIGNESGFLPCTPNGIKTLLKHSDISIEGKHVVIVGRSNIVGKPTAAILVQPQPFCNASVTIVHSKTSNIKEICKTADVIIVAVGKAFFIKEDMIKKDAIVIDVGINRINDPNTKKGYRLVGDADFEGLVDKCSYITPVPGGVGPMTIAMLLQNTLLSYQRRMGK